jgi:uncharacterized membrane protein
LKRAIDGKKHSNKVDSIENGKESNQAPPLPADIQNALQAVPSDQRKTLARLISLIISRQHHGPLPDGETIKVYNKEISEGGNRLMKLVEMQTSHRIDIEKYGARRSFNQSYLGQWMGFGIAIFFGLVAWDLAKNDHEVSATLIGTVDLASLVALFYLGKKSEK